MMNGFFLKGTSSDVYYVGIHNMMVALKTNVQWTSVFLSLSRDIVINTIMAPLREVNHRLELRVPEASEAY